MRLCLVVFFTFPLSFILMSQNDGYSWQNQPEIFSHTDSLIVISDSTGALFTSYIMKEYQTIYRISKFFGIDIDELKKYNSFLAQRRYEKGDTLIIPLSRDHIITGFFERNIFKSYHKVYYQVKPKETLFSLARRTLDMPLRQLRNRNKLSSNEISINQLLHIGWFPTEGLFEPVTSPEMTKDGLSWSELAETFAEAEHTGSIATDRGIAYWNMNSSATDEILVMHKTAPVNSYIEIQNPMFGTKVYAKVVGSIPENAFTQEVKAVISPAAARELGAKDARFFVKMRYLPTEKSIDK